MDDVARQRRIDELFARLLAEPEANRRDLCRQFQASEPADVWEEISALMAADSELQHNRQFLDGSLFGHMFSNPNDPDETELRPGDGRSSQPLTTDSDGITDDELTTGRYQIEQFLAEGGLGRVNVAFDRELKRRVALKNMKPASAGDLPSRKRFQREAEITGNLEHPGIVPVYGCGQRDDGSPYYAMRLIDGESMKASIKRLHSLVKEGCSRHEFELQLRKLIGRFLDVCQTMDYAHSRGILHRDLKPANIMLGNHGETLVVDWGLAATMHSPMDEHEPSTATRTSSPDGSPDWSDELTNKGELLGTPAFTSPEQLQHNQPLDATSDIYSLGVTLYVILTGGPPFDSTNGALSRTSRDQPVRPSVRNRYVPLPLEAICLKAMSFAKENRYATCGALADDIERFLAWEPVEAWNEPAATRLKRWGRRHLTAVAAVGVGLVTISVALLITNVLLKREKDNLKQTLGELETSQRELDEKNVKLWDITTMAANLARSGERFSIVKLIGESIPYLPAGSRDEDGAILRDWAIHAFAKTDIEVRTQRNLEELLTLDSDESTPIDLRVAFSPDMKRFAVADATAHIRVFRSVDDARLLEIPGGDSSILHVFEFSHSGRYLAFKKAKSRRVVVWDLETRRQVLRTDRPVNMGAFDFHPLEHECIVGRQGSLHVYSLNTGQLTRSIEVGLTPESLSYSPNGNRLAITSANQTDAVIWRLKDGSPPYWPLPHADTPLKTSWHPNGEWLASACMDGNIYLWNAAEGKRLTTFPLTSHPVHVSFSRSGDVLACTEMNGTMSLWNPATGERMASAGWGSRFGRYRSTDPPRFSVDDTALSHGLAENTLTTWNVAPAVVNDLRGRPGGLHSRRVNIHSPTGLITTESDDGVRFWCYADRRELARIPCNNARASATAPDGRSLLICTDNGLASVPLSWEATGDTTVLTLGAARMLTLDQELSSVRFTPDGSSALVTTRTPQGGLYRIDLAKNEWDRIGDHRHAGFLAVHPTRPIAASGPSEGAVVKVWNYESEELISELPSHDGSDVLFSPNGEWLAVSSRQSCAVYSTDNWQELHSFPKYDAIAAGRGSLAFSADSRVLAFAQDRASIRLVDTTDWQVFANLEDASRDSGVSCCFDVHSARLFVNSGRPDRLSAWNLVALRQELDHAELLDRWPLPADLTTDGDPAPRYWKVNAAEKRPNHPSAGLGQAIKQQDWQRARTILETWVDSDPADRNAQTQLVVMLGYLGEDDEYSERRAEVLQRFENLVTPDDVRDVVAASLLTNPDGENLIPLDELVARALLIPRQYPKKPRFQMMHALHALRRGDYQEVERNCKHVLALPKSQYAGLCCVADSVMCLTDLQRGRVSGLEDRLASLRADLDGLHDRVLWTDRLMAETLYREAVELHTTGSVP